MTVEKLNPFSFGSFGYYSQGMKIDLGTKTLIITAGQIALDDNGKPVAPGDYTAQAKFIFERIKQVLGAAGATIDDVVKAQFFIKDVSQYSKVSSVRNEYFANARPATTMVEIGNTVAEGCDIEIEVMAVIDNK